MNRGRIIAGTLLTCAALVACADAIAAPPRAAASAGAEVANPVTDVAGISDWLRRLVGRYRFEGSVEVVYSHEGEDYDDHRCAPLPPKPDDNGNLPPLALPYCSTIRGKGDCVAVGKGPGVQCILDVSWQEFRETIAPSDDVSKRDAPAGSYTLPGGTPYLAPSMLLLGLDPAQSGIRYLLVDDKGLPEGGVGTIKGNKATLKTSCVNGPALFAEMKPPPAGDKDHPFRIEGPPRVCNRIQRLEVKTDASVVHWSIDIEINGETWTRIEMTMRRVTDDAVSKPS